jgi:flagellar basal body-associated protein FliL
MEREQELKKQSKEKIKNIIVMIMSLIIILPLISASTWFSKDPSIDLMLSSYMQSASQL